ncbi:acyltransferase [Telmatospirillum sp.]|uniref:acyltransferase family protein n=1 Tax=Telmatospirillum sp. TaxID=2079197 RepID=UPI00284BA072|nr:acyltransferase [Telmatospirillum sp.]MDR3437874.1 acyltransferase [Telmatospirillum sp.]
MQEIKSLTSLRGLAAMAVVMQHFSATAQEHSITTIPSLIPHGYVAVDFFFVLSGFIMSYTYLSSFLRDKQRAFPSFLIKRVARLVPLNTFVIFLLLCIGPLSEIIFNKNILFTSDNLIFDAAANLLMLQGIGIGNNLNDPSWSVSTEFAVYFTFPICTLCVFHKKRIFSTFSIIISLSILLYVASRHPHLGLNSEDPVFGVLRCFSEFVLGMCAYRLYTNRSSSWRICQDPALVTLFVFCAAFLVLRIDLVAALFFPIIVVATALNVGRIKKILSSRIPYFLGMISYSIYLIHNPFRPIELEFLRIFHPAPLDTGAALTFAFLGSLSIVPFAWLTYRYIESPSRSLLRQMLQSRRQERAVAPVPNSNDIK